MPKDVNKQNRERNKDVGFALTTKFQPFSKLSAKDLKCAWIKLMNLGERDFTIKSNAALMFFSREDFGVSTEVWEKVLANASQGRLKKKFKNLIYDLYFDGLKPENLFKGKRVKKALDRCLDVGETVDLNFELLPTNVSVFNKNLCLSPDFNFNVLIYKEGEYKDDLPSDKSFLVVA